MGSNKAYINKTLTETYDQLVINSQKVCGAGYSKWGADLLVVAIEYFLEAPEEQQMQICKDGKLENFITHIMARQLKSSSSRFFYRYRKHTQSHRELFSDYTYKGFMEDARKDIDEDFSSTTDCFQKVIEKLTPFEKMVVEEIIQEGNSYTATAKKYNIPYNKLRYAKDKLVTKLQDSCKHTL